MEPDLMRKPFVLAAGLVAVASLLVVAAIVVASGNDDDSSSAQSPLPTVAPDATPMATPTAVVATAQPSPPAVQPTTPWQLAARRPTDSHRAACHAYRDPRSAHRARAH
jgi:hypothetical protein